MAIEITIIADNGGGITLQLVQDDGQRYQHSYDGNDDFRQCAADIRTAQADNNFTSWEGNEVEDEDGTDQWLIPTDDQIRNGGYWVLSVADLTDPDNDLTDWSGWLNVRDLATALTN